MKLFYQEMGSGFPVVLIHGFPFDHTIFLKTAEILKISARVILPDLRGFGRSLAAGRNINLRDMSGDICELLDDLRIERVILGGHSMGGYLGLDFCHNYPERAAGLVLIASHTAADTEEQRQARFKNIERIQSGQAREYLLDIMLPKLTAYPAVKKTLTELMVSTPVETLTAALRSMAEGVDGTQWLKESGIPVAFICGEEDMIMPVEKAVEMAARVGADLTARIPAAGHMPMMENPEITAQELQKFLKRENLQKGH